VGLAGRRAASLCFGAFVAARAVQTRKGGWRCLSRRHNLANGLVLRSARIIFRASRTGVIAQMADHPLAHLLAGFREMAEAAKRDAARATSAEMKHGYERLVKSWDELIGEMEAATTRTKQGSR